MDDGYVDSGPSGLRPVGCGASALVDAGILGASRKGQEPRVKNQGSDVLWQDVIVLFPDLGWEPFAEPSLKLRPWTKNSHAGSGTVWARLGRSPP